MLRFAVVWLALLSCAVSGSWAEQDSAAPSLPQPKALIPSIPRVVSGPSFASIGLPVCDGNGNIFYRVPRSFTSSATDGRVVEVETRTGRLIPFVLPADSSREAPIFASFAVGPDGDVFFLNLELRPGWHYHIFRLDNTGQVLAEVTPRAPADLKAEQFIVLRGGSFFIGGVHHPDVSNAQQGQYFGGLFDSTGELRSQFSGMLPRVKDLTKTRGPEPNVAVGGDGNFYFLRPDRVLVAAPDGTVLHQIPFRSPSPAGFAAGLQLSGGWMAIRFGIVDKKTGSARQEYLVLDSITGRQVALYVPSTATGPSADCFSRRDGFTFLKRSPEKMELITAPLD